MKEFYIGQIFDGVYPPEAAIWCNSNNARIITNEENKYAIEEVPEHIETIQEKLNRLEVEAMTTKEVYAAWETTKETENNRLMELVRNENQRVQTLVGEAASDEAAKAALAQAAFVESKHKKKK